MMPLRDVLMACGVMLLWGMSFTVIKLGLGDIPPMLMGALRFLLSAFPALLFVPRPKVALRWWLGYGLSVGFGQFALLFLAMRMGMPAGVASVTLQSQAFFTLVFSVLLLRADWHWTQVLGLSVAGCGLWLLAAGGAGTTHLAPFLLTVSAAACWGLSNVVVRMAADSMPPGTRFEMMGFIVWTGLVPPIPFVLMALWLNGPERVAQSLGHLSLGSIGAIAYLAFGGTILGSGLFTSLLTRYTPSRIAPFTLLVPIIGVATASIVLGEHMGFGQWSGCLLALLGLAVNVFGRFSVHRAPLKDAHANRRPRAGSGTA